MSVFVKFDPEQGPAQIVGMVWVSKQYAVMMKTCRSCDQSAAT